MGCKLEIRIWWIVTTEIKNKMNIKICILNILYKINYLNYTLTFQSQIMIFIPLKMCSILVTNCTGGKAKKTTYLRCLRTHKHTLRNRLFQPGLTVTHPGALGPGAEVLLSPRAGHPLWGRIYIPTPPIHRTNQAHYTQHQLKEFQHTNTHGGPTKLPESNSNRS